MGSSFYTCYLLLSGPVGSPKLFIHTEALAVPGQKVEVRADDGMALGWPLTRLINFIPYTMLTTVSLCSVLISTLCIVTRASLPLELCLRELWLPIPSGTKQAYVVLCVPVDVVGRC